MHNQSDKTLYLLSFDVDGTLTGPNYSMYGIHGKYEMLLKELQQLSGVEAVLNSGKSFEVLETSAVRFGGRYIIACNGAACQMIGGERFIFGGGSEDLIKMRLLLGLGEKDEGVKHITVGSQTYEVVIEEEKHDMVLTIFSEPEWVAHRYTFKGGIDRNSIYEHISYLIKEHSLNLNVLHPHGDGAVDIVRLFDSKPIDKSTLPQMVKMIWPSVPNIKIAMFGDGANDVPAMTAEGVIGITFPEADEEKVKQPVREHNGIITTLPAWIKQPDGAYKTGGGVIEGVKLLAQKGFFDDLEKQIVAICNELLNQD
jgi:hydroxymethylpyrimidine pyrophosphatase-like HAD family hydrolase